MDSKQDSKTYIPFSEQQFWQVKHRLESMIHTGIESNGNFQGFLNQAKLEQIIYQHLGVCGGGYILDDLVSGQLTYLHNRNMQQHLINEYPDMPFIEIPYRYDTLVDNPEEQGKLDEYKVLLDALYIHRRDQQPIIDEETQTSPDFYRHLPQYKKKDEKDKLLPFESKLTENFSMIYCTAGEILTYTYTWRLLFHLIQNKGFDGTITAQEPLRISLKTPFDYWDLVKDQHFLTGASWLESLDNGRFENSGKIRSIWQDAEKELNAPFGKANLGEYSMYQEYERLGLITKAEKSGKWIASKNCHAIITYLIHLAEKYLDWKHIDFPTESKVETLGGKGVVPMTSSDALRTLYYLQRQLDMYYQEAAFHPENIQAAPILLDELKGMYHFDDIMNMIVIRTLFQCLGKGPKEEVRLSDLLKRLESRSRFPILPYYYSLVVGSSHHVREHLIFCIWRSKENKAKIKLNGNEKIVEESGVVFIQLTIYPIWVLNPTFNFIKNRKSMHCFSDLSEENYIRLFRIFSLFNSLAKPVIDEAFYNKLIKTKVAEAQKSKEEGKRKIDTNAFAHEISKVTENIAVSSNMSFQQLFGEYATAAKEKLLPFLPEFEGEKVDPFEWHIIPYLPRFESYFQLLQIWAGQRGTNIFNIKELNLLEVIQACDKIALDIQTAEKLQRATRLDNFKKVIYYKNLFEKFRGDLKEGGSMNFLNFFPEAIAKKKFMDLSTEEASDEQRALLVTHQNALLRAILAALINIYEHRSGAFSMSISEKTDEKTNTPVLEVSLYNPVIEKVNPNQAQKIQKAIGTEQVLRSCLEPFGGGLKIFRLFKIKSQSSHSKKEWNHILLRFNLDSNTPSPIWITQFTFPTTYIFDHTTPNTHLHGTNFTKPTKPS